MTRYSLLVIIGPTSSGKSELAVLLARRFGGEIISADSRQVYKGMDIGTGKVTGRWADIRREPGEKSSKQKKVFVYKSVPHHLIDFANPKRRYSAALFQRGANKIIADILRRGKMPILCGGTAHWIDAVVFGQSIPDIKPNLKLRAKLEKHSVKVLFKRLMKLDPVRAKKIDKFNKRRLIRALEIVIATGRPVPPILNQKSKISNPIWLGINPPQIELFSKIKKRLKQRLGQGMLKEVAHLHKQGLSWRRLESFGLEYKFVSLYLQEKLSYDEMFELLFTAIKQYSKRQRQWWKRNKDIKWMDNPDIKFAEKQISKL